MVNNRIVRVENLGFRYRRDYVLDDVSFSAAAGEVTAVMGANGCGKTTLLKLLLGLLRPERGSIFVDNRLVNDYSPHKLARKIAYIPQAHSSPFPYSVRELVAMGREAVRGCFFRRGARDREMVEEALDRMGISGLAERIYSELSGGERQLVLIARALVQETPVIVMDEPVNGLDFGNQVRLLEIVRSLADDGLAIIKSTHFPEHALMCADHTVLIHNRKLLADGRPRDTITPANMKKIYNIDIRMMDLPDGTLSCRPEINVSRYL